ncbi:hypothetical protein R3P38DRAFT_2806298 [Favolaschia claudopus]|uniref:Uncharacterized protein n=1 Tax=Favolaschia claudopus TaxID=2862362 RepID=A0AAV9ZKB7_9AGAR
MILGIFDDYDPTVSRARDQYVFASSLRLLNRKEPWEIWVNQPGKLGQIGSSEKALAPELFPATLGPKNLKQIFYLPGALSAVSALFRQRGNYYGGIGIYKWYVKDAEGPGKLRQRVVRPIKNAIFLTYLADPAPVSPPIGVKNTGRYTDNLGLHAHTLFNLEFAVYAWENAF